MATIFGTAGDDISTAFNGTPDADTIILYSGNDTTRPGAGADQVFGGSGTDQVSYLDSTSAVQVSLSAGTGTGGFAQGDTYDGIENVFGSNFNDTIAGNGLANQLIGYIGNDTIFAGFGDDLLVGERDNDRLYGGPGNDQLSGGDGRDLLDGGTGDDTMEGGNGNDFYIVDSAGDVVQNEANFSVGGGIDTVRVFIDNYVQPTNIELVRLGNITDTQNWTVTGNDAPGTLVGNAGNNTLIGRGGNDQLNGNDGNDTITGNTGIDTMVGGAGDDVFIYTAYADSRAGSANRDIINGFDRGATQDLIDLRLLDANTTTFGVDDAFTFIGTQGFTGAAGQLRLQNLGGPNAILVEADHNGDRVADLQIIVNVQTVMFASDFLL